MYAILRLRAWCIGSPPLSMLMMNRDVSTFLNSVEIRKVIRTDAHPANFSSLATSVFDRFEVSGDKRESSTEHLAGLLERGVRVLIYSGMYDGACSWLDNENMTRIIEWTGRDAFGEQPLREWIVDGHNVGKTRSWGPLTFASLYGAGHLVSVLYRTGELLLTYV
jgi:carboxypeptidase C (cathepsin A)